MNNILCESFLYSTPDDVEIIMIEYNISEEISNLGEFNLMRSF